MRWLLAMLVLLCPLASAQMLTVSGSTLVNSAGALVPDAAITWTPTTCNTPLGGFHLGGGGQATLQGVTAPVIDGAFSLQLPDVAGTNPQNLGFHVTVIDNTTGETILDYACVQPSTSASYAATWCSTSGCNFDRYVPTTPNVPASTTSQPLSFTNQSYGPVGTPQASNGLNGFQPLTWGQLATQLAPSGPTLPLSSDGTTGGGQNGLLESFYSETACAAAQPPAGWTYAAGHACFQAGIAPATAGQPFELLRGMRFTGQAYGPASNFGLQSGAYFDKSSNNEFIGWNAAPQNTLDSTKRFGLLINQAGFNLVSGSTTTLIWGSNGNTSGTAGSTDSGPSTYWAAPGAGPFDVSEFMPGDGTAILSFMGYGTIDHSAAFRIPVTLPVCTAPCGSLQSTTQKPVGLQNIEISGSAFSDRIGPLSAVDGGYFTRSVSYDIPHRNGERNMAAMLRWALHADGTECKYDGSDSGCFNVFAWIPPGYDVRGNNRWIIHMHGFGESGLISLYSDFDEAGANVADSLFQAGYVIVTLDNSYLNCYGSPQCVADLQHVITKLRSSLALAPQPFLMADSMGGFQLFSAIANGAVVPKAALCYSCAISLRYSYTDQPSGNSLIQAAYGFSTDAQYAAATAGYDPMIAATVAGTSQSRLLAVPTLLIADPSDPTVDTSKNSQRYAAVLSALGGNVTWFMSTGGHVGKAEMNGTQAVTFLNQF